MRVKKAIENMALNSLALFNLFLEALLFFVPNLIADVELSCENYFTIWLFMAGHSVGCYRFSWVAGKQGKTEL